MNIIRNQPWFTAKAAMGITSIAVPLLAAISIAVPLRGHDDQSNGGSPYTPTRGEWLCLYLNVQEALLNSEHIPSETAIRYLYDRSRPNIIRIQVLSGEWISPDRARHLAIAAQQDVAAVARAHGWERWLRTETEQRTVADLHNSEILMR